jgi:hypothetical protein
MRRVVEVLFTDSSPRQHEVNFFASIFAVVSRKTRLCHGSYAVLWAPAGFWLFPELNVLKGNILTDVEDLKSSVKTILTDIPFS